MEFCSYRIYPTLALLIGFLGVSVCRSDQLGRNVSKDVREQVAELIEHLGNSNFRVRSNAMISLERIGLPAFEQLRAALDHPNIQVAMSVEFLLMSQNVVWWLDSDSHEVRERLQDYSSLIPRERHTRLQELALIGTEDALMALCRIAKFESDELISRAAALLLLDKLSGMELDSSIAMSSSCLLALDRVDRPATRWLTAYAHQLLAHQALLSEPTSQTPPESERFADQQLAKSGFDLEVWRQFAVELTLEVSNNRKASGEQRLQVLHYFEWLAGWSSEYQSRLDLLEMLRPSLALLSDSPFAIREYGYWALSIDLPELVDEVAKSRSVFFENNQELGYLLAEAFRQLKETERANEVAEQSLQIPKSRSKQLGQLIRGGAADIELRQRAEQARRLRDRGLFDWAEAEYIEALNLESSERSSIQIDLAELYWEGGKYDQAAEALESAVQEPPPDANLPGALYDYSSMVAHYHWYRALDASSNNDYESAMGHFRKSIEANNAASIQNPDIVVSLYRTAKAEVDRQFFQTHFDSMVQHYRSLVAREEARLAHSNFGQYAGAGNELCSYCNQLAWLLSNCEAHPEEALYLSRRSLEYGPDQPAYLDTLARCYFAADQLEEAVKHQRMACKMSPHDRLMKAQLLQFEDALTLSRNDPSKAANHGH